MFGNYSIDKELYDYIRLILPEGKTILELGSGYSTEVLSKLYKVYSIEHNIEYLNKSESTYIYAPLKDVKPTKQFSKATKWYDPNVLREILPTIKYDLLLIDGPPDFRGAFWKYKDLFNFNIPIIIDDTHWSEVWHLMMLICRKYGKDNILTLNAGRIKCFSILADKSCLLKLQ